MSISAYHAWPLARLLGGLDVNGQVDNLPSDLRRIADHLAGLPLEVRASAWTTIQSVHPLGDDLALAVVAIDPEGPLPEEGPGPPARFATIADVRRVLAETRWTWKGWIPNARVFGIAAFEGTGKTRFGLDLARRVWYGLPWPDGQPPTLPPETPTLWLCADGQHDELADAVAAFGLPDEAIIFPAPPEEPYAGTDLDDVETLATIEAAIATAKPWCVFIDTLTNATHRNLCAQDEMKELKTPLVRWVQTYGVNVALQLHLSREGQPLGRRIKGITRTTIHLECPDPENQPARLKLWVPKTFDKRPSALGVTMGDGGNEYDSDPPKKPEPDTPGRPQKERQKARDFIRSALTEKNNQIGNELCHRCQSDLGISEKTFWRAVDDMNAAGELVTDGGKGTGRQTVLHLNDPAPDRSDKIPKP